jgi:hypothetical protein
MPQHWQPDPLAAVADYCLNNGEVGQLDLTAVPEADVAAVWPEIAHLRWCLRPFQRYWIMFTARQGGARFTIYLHHTQILTCALATEECAVENVWTRLETRYLSVADRDPTVVETEGLPVCPGTLPFLATLILPPWHKRDYRPVVERAVRVRNAAAAAIARTDAITGVPYETDAGDE